MPVRKPAGPIGNHDQSTRRELTCQQMHSEVGDQLLASTYGSSMSKGKVTRRMRWREVLLPSTQIVDGVQVARSPCRELFYLLVSPCLQRIVEFRCFFGASGVKPLTLKMLAVA